MEFNNQPPEQMTAEQKRKYLFLRQKQTLDAFFSNGAINRQQYEFSYSGLITKMGITACELEEWLKS